MSVYLGRGSKGRLVAQMQRALGVDQTGSYGPRTESAVRRWQREHGRTDTGVVTTQEWTAITGQAWPPPFVVHTQLVAAIEGHGYRHPAGDYDHAGITWGLIGFTLLNTVKNKEGVAESSTGGSLYRLFRRLYADAALWDLVKAHFTVAGAAEFARVLNLDGADIERASACAGNRRPSLGTAYRKAQLRCYLLRAGECWKAFRRLRRCG